MRWLSEDEQRMWRSYLESSRLLLRALDRELTVDAGITLADYEVLVLLSEAPDRRIRMSELADMTVSTRSGITRAVTRLTEAGWVRRAECVEDRRGLYAELTADGVAKLEAAGPGHVQAVRANLFDLLSAGDVATLTDICGRLCDHLGPPAEPKAAEAGSRARESDETKGRRP